MPSTYLRFIITGLMLVGLPLAGVVFSGRDIRPFLEFPPLTRYVVHAGFSWPIFGLVAAADLMLASLLVQTVCRGRRSTRDLAKSSRGRFPGWGWIGLSIMVFGWALAWTRFSWFEAFQRHTFVLPWTGYIAVVNALCVRRGTPCPMLDRPGRFLLLFPASALFWWFFEFLNRFVQNWYYLGVDIFGPTGYVVFASLAFSTVLPAVLSTHAFLRTFPALDKGLTGLRPIAPARPRIIAGLSLLSGGTGLMFIGIWPDHLFPLLWVAPLLIFCALQTLSGRQNIFSPLRRGDWRNVAVPALAALTCGFFWEMWNLKSLSGWEYAIPFVNRFPVFKMPVAGYGGYLPFGLECLVIGQIILRPGRTARN